MIRNDLAPAPDGSSTGATMRSSAPWRLSPQGWLGFLTLGLALWFTITHAGLILEVVWVLFGAILLSLAIHPLADALARWRVPRGVTVLGVYVGLGVALASLGSLLVPLVNTEIARLQTNGPALLQAGLTRMANTPLLGRWLPSTSMLAQDLAQRLDTVVGTLVTAVAGLGGLALDVLILLVLAYFFAADAGLSERLLQGWVPARHRTRVRNLIDAGSADPLDSGEC